MHFQVYSYLPLKLLYPRGETCQKTAASIIKKVSFKVINLTNLAYFALKKTSPEWPSSPKQISPKFHHRESFMVLWRVKTFPQSSRFSCFSISFFCQYKTSCWFFKTQLKNIRQTRILSLISGVNINKNLRSHLQGVPRTNRYKWSSKRMKLADQKSWVSLGWNKPSHRGPHKSIYNQYGPTFVENPSPTWWIIPFSKMLNNHGYSRKSPKDRLGLGINGLSMAYKWGIFQPLEQGLGAHPPRNANGCGAHPPGHLFFVLATHLLYHVP